ncbi:ERAP1-like C-terminal domain-containing protein, partial [Patescibacteria group bacterium]|nr:ERAP1-like C-terminal domain-containing protein [Patescibacteria group bacterium]
TVWSELTGKISKLDSLLAYESVYEQFRNYGRKIYGRIAKKMGWQKRAGEKHTDSLLRGLVLHSLGSFGDQETIQKAKELFEKGKIDPDLRSIVYNLVAANGGMEEFETLVKMYKEEENQQEKDRLGRSLGLFKQKEILAKTLEFAISKDVRFQNTLQIIVSVWSNPEGRYLAWEFMKKNWKMLKERYAGGHYFTKAFIAMGDFTKITDAKDIEKFIAKNPTPEAKRTIAQALEKIYSNAEWLKRDRKGIMNFLKIYA